jgi:selenocysteine lyase/cysteine desulfurase
MPGSEPSEVPELASVRASEFPFARDAVYLNAASVGALPERALRAVEAFNRRRARVHELADEDFVLPVRRSRERAARLIGAEPAEIALLGNTSYGINLAALSLPVERGSTVVASHGEFPANVYPWMGREHLRLELVPTDPLGRPDEARLMERLDRGDVSVFALSHVQFATGWRADLEALGRFCRERGIFFVVDAIQSLGHLPLDVRAAHVDVLACGGHKWLCAPFGTGFAYVRRELLPRLEPAVVGWTGMRASSDLTALLDYRWELHPDARRFEVSTLGFQDFAGFAESLGLLLEVGVERIEAHLRRLLAPLVEWLRERPEVAVVSDLDPARRSGIFCFRPPAAESVHAALQAGGVACGVREGAIRLSPHLYNDESDIERVIRILSEHGARGWR